MRETTNVFEDEDNTENADVHKANDIEELYPKMLWPTMEQFRFCIRRYAVLKKKII